MISNVALHFLVFLALARPPKPIELEAIVIETEVSKPSTFVVLQMPASLVHRPQVSGLERFMSMMATRTGLGSAADDLLMASALEKKAADENLLKIEKCATSDAENCAEIDLREAAAYAEKARAKLVPNDPLEAMVHALLWRIYQDAGPAFDSSRAKASLEAILRLEIPADIGAWTHFTLGSAARDEGRFEDAHRHFLAGQALDATLPGGPRWFFDYLLAYTEWALRMPEPARRMEAALARARAESPDIVSSLELDLLPFWGLEPSKVATHLTYLETHCGPRAQSLAQELLSIYSDLGEVDSSRQVMHWLSERSSQ